MEKRKLAESEIQNFREILGSHHGGMGAGGKNICKIGKGGHGLVYKTYSDTLGKEVAIKKITRKGESRREQLLYEEQQKENFRSPALLEIYHADDQLVVMELCGHGDLASCIGRSNSRSLGVRTLLEKNFIPLLEALSELHERNLVHQDIKPANILVGEGGVLKLGDFGLAKRCEADGGPTLAGRNFCGTLLYLCPERALCSLGGYSEKQKWNAKYPNLSLKRNDGWALGLSLIEVLFNVEVSNFLREALDEMGNTRDFICGTFPEVWNKILLYPQKWRLFISNKLKKLKPAVEPTMELVLTQLLEPDPAQALSLDRIAYEFRKKEMAIPTYLYPLVDVLDLADSALRGTVDLAIIPTLDYLTATVGSAAGFVFRRIQSLFGRRREEEYNGQRLDDAKSKLLEDSGYLLNIQVPGEARARTPGLAEATGQLHLGNGNKHPTGQGSASTQLGIITDAIEDSSALGAGERDGSQMKI